MRRKKLLIWALAIYAVVFIFVFVVPDLLHRRDFDKAFFAWLHDPTPQNQAMLRHEEFKNDVIRLEFSAVVSLVAVSVVGCIYSVGVLISQRTRPGRRHSAGQ